MAPKTVSATVRSLGEKSRFKKIVSFCSLMTVADQWQLVLEGKGSFPRGIRRDCDLKRFKGVGSGGVGRGREVDGETGVCFQSFQ